MASAPVFGGVAMLSRRIAAGADVVSDGRRVAEATTVA
jgi:hypothetical protein